MAAIEIDSHKILGNVKKINDYMKKYDKKWTLTLKILSGHTEVLKPIMEHEIINSLHSVADSRLSSLKNIKKLHPEITTMYIKPPHIKWVKSIVNYADISLNTTKEVIEALNVEAKKAGKIHKIIIMLELGELREGILREKVLDFYSEVFNLSNIEVIGMGTNLGCMYGIEPTYDKLMQLSLYKELIQAKFDKKLKLVSGGSSITLPLLKRGKVPANVNHFRIGEAVFLGTSPLDGKKFDNLSSTAFTFLANIIELKKKENIPDGVMGEGSIGNTAEVEEGEIFEKSYRALLDFGKIDVDFNDLIPCNSSVKFVGTTSDMTVCELGQKKRGYSVGKEIKFRPNYMAVVRLMTSKFIDKIVV